MTDKTFTDEEIVKALEHCSSSCGSDACVGCPFDESGVCTERENALPVEALALINCQKAELEDERAKSKMCADVIARQDKMIAEQAREIAMLKGKPFYTPEDVSKMTLKQVRKNYSAIMDSMKGW